MCAPQHHSFIGAAIDNWASISCVKLKKWQDSEKRQSCHSIFFNEPNAKESRIANFLTRAKVAIAKIAKSGHDFARVKVEALVNH